METARDYAGALIRRVPPMYPCARVTLLSEYSACLHFLCSPVPPEPQVTNSPRVPVNPELLLPLTPHQLPWVSAPWVIVPPPPRTGPVPTQEPSSQRFLPKKATGAWWGAPEVRGSPKTSDSGECGVASFCSCSYRI